MFDGEILGLAAQGLTTGTIAKRVGVEPHYVRSVLFAELTGCEVKPDYNARKDDDELQHRAAVAAAVNAKRRETAEAKRADALRLLAESQ
jgi:hypothetical protein